MSPLGNSQNISIFFHYYYICYGDLCPVIFDISVVIILESYKLYSYKEVNWIDW